MLYLLLFFFFKEHSHLYFHFIPKKTLWPTGSKYYCWKSESESCLLVFDSLQGHGILQARILEWVAFLFSRGSSQPRDQTQVSHIASRLFTSWATREAQEYWSWVTYPFSSGSSQPRNWTGVSWIAGDSSPTELSGKSWHQGDKQ